MVCNLECKRHVLETCKVPFISADPRLVWSSHVIGRACWMPTKTIYCVHRFLFCYWVSLHACQLEPLPETVADAKWLFLGTWSDIYSESRGNKRWAHWEWIGRCIRTPFVAGQWWGPAQDKQMPAAPLLVWGSVPVEEEDVVRDYIVIRNESKGLQGAVATIPKTSITPAAAHNPTIKIALL